jgi:hypothetical protein
VNRPFLLSEVKHKNALVNPPPKFGNECKHLRECISERKARVMLQFYICKILQQFYFFTILSFSSASLNHKRNACSCSTHAYPICTYIECICMQYDENLKLEMTNCECRYTIVLEFLYLPIIGTNCVCIPLN